MEQSTEFKTIQYEGNEIKIFLKGNDFFVIIITNGVEYAVDGTYKVLADAIAAGKEGVDNCHI